jgi:copper homeostasis protein
MSVLLEVCVDDAAGIAEAVAGGADRLELCTALELGGLTPSTALIDRAVASGVPVHVLVRPRAGDFVLDDEAEAVVRADIVAALARGAAGVVVGALGPDGGLDRERLARLRDAARDGAAVLHRAVDLLADPVAAVDAAMALGFDAILTSGGARSAPEGAATLARMVQAARGRVQVMAGAGIMPDEVVALVAQTGVAAVHASCSRAGPDPDARLCRLGFAAGPRRSTDRAIVAAMRAALAGEEHHG